MSVRYTNEKEEKIKWCDKHRVWYVEGEQPCNACLSDAKENTNAAK